MNITSLKALSIIIAGFFLSLNFVACTESVTEDIKTLNRGNGSEAETLDPQLVRSESAGNIVRDLYEGLLTESADGSLVAGVADAWGYNSKTLCYEFTLKSNVRWSNGDLLLAEDFKRGMEFALNPKNLSPYSELLKPIKRINALSDKRLDLCVDKVVPYFFELLVIPVSYPRHISYTTKNTISNGAYQLKQWIPQDKVELIKNNDFHDAASVFFDTVNYITTENSSSELKRFLAKELDVTATVPTNDVARIRERHQAELKISPVLNTYFYGFNLSEPPFKNNKSLRKALSLSIDRRILVDKILGTGEKIAWSLVPPGMRDYQVPEILYKDWTTEKREKEAKRLYKEAGYSNEKPLRFELRYNTSPLHKKTAVAIASMWKSVLGVEVELYNEEWKVFIQNRRNKQTQMFRSGWIADVNDASNYLELLSSSHPLNDYAYNNEYFDELLDLAKSENSNRISILQAAEKQMLNDQAIVPLYYYVSKHLVDKNLNGWENNLLDHHLSRYISRNIK